MDSEDLFLMLSQGPTSLTLDLGVSNSATLGDVKFQAATLSADLRDVMLQRIGICCNLYPLYCVEMRDPCFGCATGMPWKQGLTSCESFFMDCWASVDLALRDYPPPPHGQQGLESWILEGPFLCGPLSGQ